MMSSTRRQADRGIRPLFHSKRAKAAMIVVGGLAPLATIGAFAASAAVPAFPDNIVVFPDRDFVTVEGYQNHLGETATLEDHPRRHGRRQSPRPSSPRATSRSRSTIPAACAGAPART